MVNFVGKTKEKVVIKEIDSNIDLLKIFHYSHTRSGSFFLDSALQNQKTGRPIKKKTTLAIHNYVSRAREYLKMCGGIRIDDSDYADYLTFPADENDEEVEGLQEAGISATWYTIPETEIKLKIAVSVEQKSMESTTGSTQIAQTAREQAMLAVTLQEVAVTFKT